MSICGKLSSDILVPCATPLVAGVNDKLRIINQDDLVSVLRDNANPQIITAITMVSGKKAFTVEGKNSSNDVKAGLVKKRYSESFNHEILFRVFNNNAAIKKELAAMAKGKFIAIVENNFGGTGGDAKYEIFGLDVGLEVSAIDSDKSDSETQGAWVITMKSNENFLEPHLPATFFDGTLSSTKTKVLALDSAAA